MNFYIIQFSDQNTKRFFERNKTLCAIILRIYLKYANFGNFRSFINVSRYGSFVKPH